MKKKCIIRFILTIGCAILVVLPSVHALAAEAPSLKHQKIWGTANQLCIMHRGVQTADGGYIIAGEWADNVTDVGPAGSVWYDHKKVPLLVKTNANVEEVVNRKYYQLYELGWFMDVKQTADGGYIAAGASLNKSLQIYLVKTDSNLNLQWSKTFGGGPEAFAVEQTSDGGYLIAGGWTNSTPSGTDNAYIIKTDANGQSVWNKAYGGEDDTTAYTINKTADGGYIVGGTKVPHGSQFFTGWLFKISKDGDPMQINQTYGEGSNNLIISVKQTADGGYIAAGAITPKESNNTYGWLFKVNAQGELIESHKDQYNNNTNNRFLSVEPTKDGGYIVAGRTTFANNSSAAYIAKFDSTLKQKLWDATYNFEEHSDCSIGSIQQTKDGGYFFVGRAGAQWPFTGGAGWAAKLDPEPPPPTLLQQIGSGATPYANQIIPAVIATVIGGILVAILTSVLLGRRQNK